MPRTRIGVGLRRAMDAMDGLPVFATDHRLDVVAWNRLGAALMGGLDVPGRRDANNARFVLLDPAARDLHPDWEERAAEVAGQLRVAAGRHPDDRELTGLIAELADVSPEFRRFWASEEVTMCAAGRKRLRHPVVGLLELDFETLHVPAGPGSPGWSCMCSARLRTARRPPPSPGWPSQLFQVSSYGSLGVATGRAEVTFRYGIGPLLTGSVVRSGV